VVSQSVFGDAPLLELHAWVAHRRRRVEVRTATKNQLIAQLGRALPGLGGALRDVQGSKVAPASRGAFPTRCGWSG
jgi:hypothetical protein